MRKRRRRGGGGGIAATDEIESAKTKPKTSKAEAKQIRSRSATTKAKAKEIYTDIATNACVSVSQVKEVFDAVRQVLLRELRAKGACMLPNLVLFRLSRKPAADAKVKNMFGKEVHIPAKPARTQVKAYVLKHMLDAMVEE